MNWLGFLLIWMTLCFVKGGQDVGEWQFGVEALLKIVKSSPELNQLVLPDAKLMRLETGFRFTEGPAFATDGALIFSDIPSNRIYRMHPNGKLEIFREPSGGANGNTIDAQGRLLTCEGFVNKRVVRTDLKSGKVEVIASEYEGKPLNQPNDIIATKDGRIYFTDPVFGDPKFKTQPVEGIYLVKPDGTLVCVVADERNQPKPNGLALSPDGKWLYTTDSQRNVVRVYEVKPDGTLGEGRDLAKMEGRDGAGDGMRVDEKGNIWATGPDGIWIFAPDGKLIGMLQLPEVPANLCFGGPDGKHLFITARTSVYLLKANVAGAKYW
ncbi:MAG: SMP-30/gluconolactonase/LRE family protein [Armatimonadota bacterium]|nr:SMP-30/gluconolactonase/LRE family protein [Armatimonadota bacterium]